MAGTINCSDDQYKESLYVISKPIHMYFDQEMTCLIATPEIRPDIYIPTSTDTQTIASASASASATSGMDVYIHNYLAT